MNSAFRRAKFGASLFTALYPRAFLTEFGEEMRYVLEQSFLEAANRGALSVLWVGVRELVDLPANLLREYLEQLGRKENWIMNRLSPSPIDRAGQLGALGYGLGFALLGLFFATIMVANSAIPSLPLGIAWIAASFIAGCLGGAGIGLGADPRQVWKYTLLAGAALALANTVSLFVERLGFTWYLLNMDHGAVSFGYSVLSALLVGPLTGLFLGLAQKGFQRGLVLAGTGLLAFVLGFVAFMMVALTLIQGEAGIHTGLGAHPHSTWVLILAGMGFMGLTGAVGGVILGRSSVDPLRMQDLSLA